MRVVCPLRVGVGLPFLLFALAASDPCLSQRNDSGINIEWLGISSQADLDVLINCSTITYGLGMSPNTTVQGIVTLPNLVTLKALYIDEAQGPIPITGFLFPQLTTITDSLELFSEHITTLEFPLLSEVGDIIFLSLPALRSWSGTDSLQSVGKLLLNRHNISSLSFGNLSTALGLSFFFSSPYGSLYLNGTASPAVLVAGSNDTTLVNDLRDTTTTAIVGCNNITINSVSASSLEIFMNPDLEQLYMPNLVSLGPYNSTAATYIDSALEPPGAGLSDTLLIADNPKIQEFSFPNLTTIQGTLEILNNDLLFAIEGFPLLRNVSGNISLIGNLEPYANIGYFPNLAFVGGNINLTSTISGGECDYFPPLFNEGILKGNLYCKTPTETINLTHTQSPTSTPSASKLNKHTMIGIGFGVVLPGLTLTSLIAFCIIKPPRRITGRISLRRR